MNLNLIISCFISCYVYDKHNMNLSVLIFLKTYVCKHESNHIEPKPTQKNCSSRSNCLLTNTYYIERFYTIPIRQVGWAFDILLLNFFHSKEPLLKLTTMYNNCHLSQKEKKVISRSTCSYSEIESLRPFAFVNTIALLEEELK